MQCQDLTVFPHPALHFQLTLLAVSGRSLLSLYLIHSLVWNVVGMRLVHWTSGFVKNMEGGLMKEILKMGPVFGIFMPLVFWIAEFSTRHTGRDVVLLARWKQGRCFC